MAQEESKEARHYRFLNDKRNRLGYWYPVVVELGIPAPKTIIIPLSQEAGRKWLEAEQPLSEEFNKRFREACDQLGYPVFIRSDECSGKHDWKETCFIKDRKEDIFQHLYRVLEYNEMADLMGLNYSAVVVREYIEPYHLFTAFRGMPVSREYRVFARDGKLECWHHYWFEEAMETGYASSHRPPLPKNWRDLLKETYRTSPQTMEFDPRLKDYAEQVTRRLDGYWSVDFLYAKDQWWLTDMALGEASYHLSHTGPVTREGRD